jgi:hypothetical protein
MDPYDKDKIDQANNIYSQLLEVSIKKDLPKLKELRSKAINGLGILFCTETLYERLLKSCHPKNFSGEYYDAKKLSEANNLYDKILKNADNIEVLEDCEIRAKGLIALVEKREQKEQGKQEEEKEKARIQKLCQRIDDIPYEIKEKKIVIVFLVLTMISIMYASIEAEFLFVFVLGLFIIMLYIIYEINRQSKEKEELEQQYNEITKK